MEGGRQVHGVQSPLQKGHSGWGESRGAWQGRIRSPRGEYIGV